MFETQLILNNKFNNLFFNTGTANDLDLLIPLSSDMFSDVGDVTESFNRDTTATVTDFEGVIHEAQIDELRFPGLRRVENLLSNTDAYVTETVTLENGSDYILSCEGSGSITLSGASTLVLSSGEITFTATSTTLTLTVSGEVTSPQLEAICGSQVIASDYISSGVLSWPYHGAGVDGVKYFTTDRDGGALTSSGVLIEDDATNLFINSDTPVTQTITVVSGSDYTISCTGTGSATITGAGTGVASEGTDITITASTTSLVCTVDTLDTVQVELGSTATSYIPTEGSTVTRTVDQLSYAVSSVITQGQGSVYYSVNITNGNNDNIAFLLSDGTYSNMLFHKIDTSNVHMFKVFAGGVQMASTVMSVSDQTDTKILVTYSDSSVSIYVDGVLISTTDSITIPTGLRYIHLGSNLTHDMQTICTIKDVRYYSDVIQQSRAEAMTSTSYSFLADSYILADSYVLADNQIIGG